MTRWSAALSVVAITASVCSASAASAAPSRWKMARDPKVFDEEQVKLEAERELILDRNLRLKSITQADPILRHESHVVKAARALEEGGAATAKDWYLRMLLARVYQRTSKWAESVLLYGTVTSDPDVPEVFAADAYSDVAIACARLNRQTDEVEIYETAIALEPYPSNRSTMLANQAEGFMVMGDISRAIAGYRAALEGVPLAEAPRVTPTTLWSLGVALDRSGDLEGAFDSIARARSYDPRDTNISGSNWFYVPAYDSDYYAALGQWLTARRGEGTEVRLGAYERSIIAWKQFLGRAPESDHYVPVAKARLKLIEKEYEEYGKRVRTPTPVEGAAGAGATKKKKRPPGPEDP